MRWRRGMSSMFGVKVVVATGTATSTAAIAQLSAALRVPVHATVAAPVAREPPPETCVLSTKIEVEPVAATLLTLWAAAENPHTLMLLTALVAVTVPVIVDPVLVMAFGNAWA